MTETLNEEQVEKVVKYIQKKERLISALDSAVRTAMRAGEAQIYVDSLNELIILLLDDKLLPDSFDTNKYFPDLYPRAVKKKEVKNEDKDVS